jgi:hypothetical protein
MPGNLIRVYNLAVAVKKISPAPKQEPTEHPFITVHQPNFFWIARAWITPNQRAFLIGMG